MSAPNCYACVHRRDIPGDAHSSCHHPAFTSAHANPMANVLAIFASVGRGGPISIASGECAVVGDPHGIRMGWFNHPFNFDPAWLRSCSGFTPRESGESA